MKPEESKNSSTDSSAISLAFLVAFLAAVVGGAVAYALGYDIRSGALLGLLSLLAVYSVILMVNGVICALASLKSSENDKETKPEDK